jgi:hypothetical protein
MKRAPVPIARTQIFLLSEAEIRGDHRQRHSEGKCGVPWGSVHIGPPPAKVTVWQRVTPADNQHYRALDTLLNRYIRLDYWITGNSNPVINWET